MKCAIDFSPEIYDARMRIALHIAEPEDYIMDRDYRECVKPTAVERLIVWLIAIVTSAWVWWVGYEVFSCFVRIAKELVR